MPRSKIEAAKSDAQRFWERVQQTDTCWVWIGGKSAEGYGGFSVGSRPAGTLRHVGAHRFAYELLVGPIPEGAHLDHLCRNTSCVRPDHLEPVSSWENIQRGKPSPPVLNKQKTCCVHGHEFTPENTWRDRRGSRHCRVCMRARWRKWDRSRRAQRPSVANSVKAEAEFVRTGS